MSNPVLLSFEEAFSALERALNSADVALIEDRSEQFRAAIFRVRALGSWRDAPDLARRAAALLGRVEATQQHVKRLTRDTRERLSGLESSRVANYLNLYKRTGMHTRT